MFLLPICVQRTVERSCPIKTQLRGWLQPIRSNTSGSDNVELMIHVLGLTRSSLSKFCNRDIFHVMKLYPLWLLCCLRFYCVYFVVCETCQFSYYTENFENEDTSSLCWVWIGKYIAKCNVCQFWIQQHIFPVLLVLEIRTYFSPEHKRCILPWSVSLTFKYLLQEYRRTEYK